MFPRKKRQIHVCIFPNCDFQCLILLPTIKKIFIIQVYPLQGIMSTTVNLMRSSTLAGHTMSVHPTHIHVTYPTSRGFSLAWRLAMQSRLRALTIQLQDRQATQTSSQMLKAICRRETSAHTVHTLYPPTGTMSHQTENEATNKRLPQQC